MRCTLHICATHVVCISSIASVCLHGNVDTRAARIAGIAGVGIGVRMSCKGSHARVWAGKVVFSKATKYVATLHGQLLPQGGHIFRRLDPCAQRLARVAWWVEAFSRHDTPCHPSIGQSRAAHPPEHSPPPTHRCDPGRPLTGTTSAMKSPKRSQTIHPPEQPSCKCLPVRARPSKKGGNSGHPLSSH